MLLILSTALWPVSSRSLVRPPAGAEEAPPQPDVSPRSLAHTLELSAYFADYAKRLRPLVTGLLDTVGKVGNPSGATGSLGLRSVKK